jgi:hypothetical protein
MNRDIKGILEKKKKAILETVGQDEPKLENFWSNSFFLHAIAKRISF